MLLLWIEKTTGLCHIEWVLYMTDKKDLESSNKYSVFSNLSIYYAWKKGYMKATILAYEDKHEIKDLNDLIETIIFLLFWIIL